MLYCWPRLAVAHTVHWLCLSSLSTAETQKKKAKQVLLSQSLHAPFHSTPPAHMPTRTNQVTGITLKMGKSWRKVLLQGMVSVQYGLVNDGICPQAGCMRWCHLSVFACGNSCSSSVVIQSTQFLCMLLNMLPFSTADTELRDKVANFYPHCPVILNE